MSPLDRSLIPLLMLCLATMARAYDVAPVSDPEALGFSSSRLARIAAWQQAQVDAGAFSGAVAAIARNGKVAYLRAVGFRDHAKTVPLRSDAIFWIASATKPITSVAAMMLVEEGKLDLAAPVHQYIPAFKDVMVGVETHDPVSGETRLALEPQKRPMIVEDLLRHTSGFVYEDQGTSSTARANCGKEASRAMARCRTSRPVWRGSHSPISQARSGNMAAALTCWDGSSRWPRVSRSISFSTAACSNRSAWSTPPSGYRRGSLTVCSTHRSAYRLILIDP